MHRKRILIAEDDIFIAMELEEIVAASVPSSIIITECSLAHIAATMQERWDFAILDVNLTNGQTFDIARILRADGVPFVFLSGSLPEELPEDVRVVPFIAKPFEKSQIAHALREAFGGLDSPETSRADRGLQ
ncbi:MAG TPA: hypothetical protein VE999_03710 [Gemmataceae bacterium]|nr:hypothetical protein [Gemmataceae bacterium]